MGLFKVDFQLFKISVIRSEFLLPVEVPITGSRLYYIYCGQQQWTQTDQVRSAYEFK